MKLLLLKVKVPVSKHLWVDFLWIASFNHQGIHLFHLLRPLANPNVHTRFIVEVISQPTKQQTLRNSHSYSLQSPLV